MFKLESRTLQDSRAKLKNTSRLKRKVEEHFKTQEEKLKNISRFKRKVKFKNQESRFKNNQDQDSRLKIQESREESIKISIKKIFKTFSSTWSFHKFFYQRVLLSGNRLSEGSNQLPVASIVFQTDLQSCNRLP